MILYNAVGGGLGHVTRAHRVLEALGLEAEILTSADVPASLEHRPLEHRAWMRERARGATRIIADTFPAGIQGELCGLDIPIDHVARILKWNEYRRAVPYDLPKIGTTYVVEALTPEHESFVRQSNVVNLVLSGAAAAPAAVAHPYWLIVHSGPEHEVQELIAYTQSLSPSSPVLVATLCDLTLPAGFHHLRAHPAHPLFANAERIISAAGFNVMLETEPWRDKHVVLPFPRRFDDQFLRAARRRTAAHQQRAGDADRAADHRQ